MNSVKETKEEIEQHRLLRQDFTEQVLSDLFKSKGYDTKAVFDAMNGDGVQANDSGEPRTCAASVDQRHT